MSDRFPMTPYPDGWFAVAYSDELAPGAVLPARYFGEELVLFRTASGAPQVLGAFCPHLGAHLGHGGCVEGESVACPFHKWRFDGTGACIAIPYAQKIPPKARARSWPARDLNGFVMVHHSSSGDAPAWEPPAIPEFGAPDWTPTERRQWRVRTHIQETNENNCDSAHLRYLHGLVDPSTEAHFEDHVMHVRTHGRIDSERIGMPGLDIEGDILGTHWGLGMLRQQFKLLVDGVLLSLVTPVDEEHVDIRFAFTVKHMPTEELTQTVRQMMIRDLERDVSDDIKIWEHKAYLEHPLLCDGDGPI
ncbi:MAG TPA: Rieske 2Fe-2S domain-containing protein, partial [Polyangia bacterium]|nr:Rieske 2Fe-2S domain-containing protein [Polyangia bacterium]